MFRLKNVTRRFGTRVAVDNVTFDIPQGQMVGVIGRSGAGKSTMLRMINRLADPSEGTIHFNDIEVSSLRGSALRNWQRDCAMIFQQFNLVPRLDVLTNVLLGRLNYRSTVMSILNLFTREERIMAIAALERLVGRQALEISKGGSEARTAAEKRDYVRDHRPRASMTFSLLGAGAMSPPPIAVTTSRSSRTWRKRSCPMAPTSSGSRTSPMSRSQAFMSPSSSTPGHARWWAMRSPGRSTCG